MTHGNVERILGRLLTDPALRQRYGRSPGRLIAELRSEGIELSEVEAEALAGTDAASLQALAERLDRRLRRADSAPLDELGLPETEP
jgi:hypothetical protein